MVEDTVSEEAHEQVRIDDAHVSVIQIIFDDLRELRVKEPCEEPRDSKISELLPVVSEVGRVEAEVNDDEGGDQDCVEQGDVQGVNGMMHVNCVFVEEVVGQAPEGDAEESIDEGPPVVELLSEVAGEVAVVPIEQDQPCDRDQQAQHIQV